MRSTALSLLALVPCLAEAKSTTHYSTETVFIPPRKTGSATNIYASLITEDASKTEYLLACQTNFGSSYTCDGEFTGVTVTYEKSRMDVAFDVTSYGCGLGKDKAVCALQIETAKAETTTLASSESSLWMTAITVVDVKKRKTTSTKSHLPKETGTSNRLCKRKVHHGSGDSDSSSGGSSGSSGGDKSGDSDAPDDTSSDGASSSSKPKKNDDDDCSAGSVASWSWSVVALGFGGYLGLNLA
ncbi:Ff.00g061860.m01.CDS01 [Fusarium sp. VM40]|nr:Ff.00g061860.m01.CDS01 [Fusarium sp. VM40]